MADEEKLFEVIPSSVHLRLVEPRIYSLYPDGENSNIYDHGFGTIYELVACNRFYNRMVWGYSIAEYPVFCSSALDAAEGWVLDAGCGSLAFAAETYINYPERNFVCLDQSIKMLKLAKSRLKSQFGKVPDNIFLLHGNVLRMPFRAASFPTVISLNVLHVIHDIRTILGELKSMVADGGTISLTTMIESNRFADKYLLTLGRKGMVIPRTADELFAAIEALDISFTYRIQGNMAFIRCKQRAWDP